MTFSARSLAVAAVAASTVSITLPSSSVTASTRNAVRRGNDQRRRNLSYERIALYEPGSQVTDHAAIDLDQQSMETQIALGTEESFQNAKAIFQQGGHSKSYAEVNLNAPLGTNIPEGTIITGQSAGGEAVRGKAYENHSVGDTKLQIQYITTDVQASYVDCQVGALSLVGEANTNGCFASNGTLAVEGGTTENLQYSYDINQDNKNGRTLAGFSTSAESKMYKDCPGCPYEEYKKYFDYYGVFDYANEWVLAALDGRTTTFKRGNNNFSTQSTIGRGEGAKKGSAYMAVYMYVLREFYDAVDDCQAGCINCNDDPVHAWDEGVAFYAGSLEVPDGTGAGYLLHELADKRSMNFKTSGPEGTDVMGTAQVNYDLMSMFTMGKFNLLSGNCHMVKEMIPFIASLMSVPLIQGTLRYAYKMEFQSGGEREKAEGAVFAAAVLPRLHACDEDAAKIVYDNMGQSSTSTSFQAVKDAFESQYTCMFVSCDMVGGLWDDTTNTYFEGAVPCIDQSTAQTASAQQSTSGPNPVALGLGITAAVIAVFACGCVGFMIRREKTGNPVFQGDGKEMS